MDAVGVWAGGRAVGTAPERPGFPTPPIYSYPPESKPRQRAIRRPTFAKDGVHPGDLGHLVMAPAIAAELGLTVSADPDAELARLPADPVFALSRDRRELRSEG